MGTLSPIVVALAIISVVGFIGAIIAIYQRSLLFSGYKDLVGDAREIARGFRGNVYRDGNDLVISGNRNKLPVTVRFSQEENTPGLFIRMEMPATFQMTIVPQGSQHGEGRAVVRLGDMQFDNRFTIRTDHPSQFRMMLSPRSTSNVQKLCCSGRTYLHVVPGAMELSELVIPNAYVARHVNDHLQQMAEMAAEMAEMPGANEIKIQPIHIERNVVARSAIAIGVIAAIGTVAVGYTQRQPTIHALAAEKSGIEPADARLMPGVDAWQLVDPANDYDGAAMTWARNNSLQLSGHMAVDLSGTGEGRDDVYVLRRADGSFRLTLLSRGENRFDVIYDKLALVAPFPRRAIDSVQWVGAPPSAADGDGILVALDPANPSKVVAIFLSGGRITSGQPANYQGISY